MAGFSLQHIDFLLALAAIPVLTVLFFLLIQWKKRTVKKIGDEMLVKEMTRHHSSGKFAIKFILVLAAFAAITLALTNPRSNNGSEKVNRNGIDVMIALDVSKSMLAQDIKPSRLDRAKQLLGKLIDKLSNDRIGIVVFAGRSYLQMPLTGDHGAAKMYLAAANTDAVPTQGTVISDALKMCYSAFSGKEKKYKAVILISDGEDHDEGAQKAASDLASDGIVVNTVGIGSPGGSEIIDETTNQPKKDNNGNVVISKLNEEELRTIAEKGNGIYQLFTNTDEVVSALDSRLSTMDQRTVTEDSLINYKSFFQWLAALALIILMVEFFMSERTKRIAAVAAAIFCSIMIPFHSGAQNEKKLIKKGNEAYGKSQFSDAIAQYKKVTDKNPDNATAQFNMGNALYRDQKSDDAVAAFDKALSTTPDKMERSKAFYNKGVVLQNNKKLPECIEAYKNALKLDPDDEDARQNLQKALIQQKQQQQNKNDKQDKKKEQKQDQKKEKQDQQEPKPQPSKLTKQDAEQKLKALLQQEKNLQEKLRRVNESSPVRPEKDW
jgi:Ca-activated chloride channel family protein